jgi:hypothetical protein
MRAAHVRVDGLKNTHSLGGANQFARRPGEQGGEQLDLFQARLSRNPRHGLVHQQNAVPARCKKSRQQQAMDDGAIHPVAGYHHRISHPRAFADATVGHDAAISSISKARDARSCAPKSWRISAGECRGLSGHTHV